MNKLWCIFQINTVYVNKKYTTAISCDYQVKYDR